MKELFNRLASMREEVRRELSEDIVPFWLGFLGDGKTFAGRIDGEGRPHEDAPKGAVLLFRMLWSFSSAYRTTGDPASLDAADKVYEYVTAHFIDKEHGGVFWSVDNCGAPLSTKKQSYALGFAIYGLSEYSMASGNPEARSLAMDIYEKLESHAWDESMGGYLEALSADWSPLEDMRLSDKDMNTAMSMNTHLHILEPYTALYMLTSDSRVKDSVLRLLTIFRDRILDSETGHLGLFFDRDWKRLDNEVSYGHDIEASWLIDEAAAAIGVDFGKTVEKIAVSTVPGLMGDGSMAYELDCSASHRDEERHWWVQAETVIGFMNMFMRTSEERYFDICRSAWGFISSHLVDRIHGEWYWSIMPDGSANVRDDKAGFWKCPYHNSRMCLELIRRIGSIID